MYFKTVRRNFLCVYRYIYLHLFLCLIFFLTQVYNVNLKQAAWFSAVPWGAMALSGYVAGATSDFMIKSGCSIINVRKIMQVPLSFLST